MLTLFALVNLYFAFIGVFLQITRDRATLTDGPGAMSLFDWIADPAILASLVTLTVMEIVLGIDNIIFISVIVGRLPEPQAKRARQIGLALALVFRIVLLLGAVLADPPDDSRCSPLPGTPSRGATWCCSPAACSCWSRRPARSTRTSRAARKSMASPPRPAPGFGTVVAQIVAHRHGVLGRLDRHRHRHGRVCRASWSPRSSSRSRVMYVASGAIAGFISRHPTTRMLALAFLLMIGAALIADGIGFHIPRGYLYAAMAFSAGVEGLNVVARRNRTRNPSREHPGRLRIAGAVSAGVDHAAPPDHGDVLRAGRVAE